MTRSIGDKCATRLGVECIPDVKHIVLDKDDRYLLLATDGLWDGVAIDQACKLIAPIPTAKAAATKLVAHGVESLGKLQLDDNITALVVGLDNAIVSCD